jgi:archaellum biogenesis ATPase FlaH
MGKFEELLERTKAKKSGSGYMALCPAHADKKASLSIRQENGQILLFCQASCSTENVLAAIGWTFKDLYSDSSANAAVKIAPKVEPRQKPPGTTFTGTEEQVQSWCAASAESLEFQGFLKSRGIEPEVARELRWGFAPSWAFPNVGQQPAILIPHYVDDDGLVGIKFRAIAEKHWSQVPGSKTDGLYRGRACAFLNDDVFVFEGPLDCALAASHGINAVAINAASSKLLPSDIEFLSGFKRIYLVGDSDRPGREAMTKLAAQLDEKQVIRAGLHGFKDIGEMWKADPANFKEKFKYSARHALASRTYFEFDDLFTEVDISKGLRDTEQYIVDKLVPKGSITMLFGEEKSGKSLLATYILKCVANGVKVFGRYAVEKTPVLYLDLENSSHDIGGMSSHFRNIGPELIRYKMRTTGCPELDDPGLIEFCKKNRPLIVIDSLTKFSRSADPFNPKEMSAVFDKMLDLCAAGATIILIHHSKKGEEEKYANSHQIGAAVCRAFAIKSHDRPKLQNVTMIGTLFRGAEPVSVDLIAFPLISDEGRFGLRTCDTESAELEDLVQFVSDQPGGECCKEHIKKRKGRSHRRNLELLKLAMNSGRLEEGSKGPRGRKISVPKTENAAFQFSASANTGTVQNDQDA